MTPKSELGKTELKRQDLYRDRWSSYGENTGVLEISDRLSSAELKKIDIFLPYDDAFLQRISPDASRARWRANSVLFEEGTYIDLAFFVVAGSVEVSLTGILAPAQAPAAPIFDPTRTMLAQAPADPSRGTMLLNQRSKARPKSGKPPSKGEPGITLLSTMDFDLPRGVTKILGPGEFFGEIGALSGWPQPVTAATRSESDLVQIRLPALRLMRQKSKDLKNRLDALYKERVLVAQLQSTPLFAGSTEEFLETLKKKVELVSCDPDDPVVREGEPVDALYLVRSGFVKLTQRYAEGQMTVSYLSKGMTLGDVELLVAESGRWEATATSVEYSELVKIPAEIVREVLARHPEIKRRLWQSGIERAKEFNYSKRNVGHPELIEVALERGLVQGNSILAIDLDVCTRCDDCVRACAATHEGRPRFVREGSKYHNLLIAKSCYHCRDPVCLVGCPTGAIHRAGSAAVVEIDEEICIGCSTCANNCPYDAIMMLETGTKWPGDMVPVGLRGRDRQLASKCDLCADTGHGPACVSNCPQGCAFRVGSMEELQDLLKRKE